MKWTPIIFRLGLCLGVTLFVTSCSVSTKAVPNPLGKSKLLEQESSSGSSRDLEPRVVPEGDTQIASEQKPTRPTEDGEGLPGYLVDPSLVNMVIRDTSDDDEKLVIVSAPAGSLKGFLRPDLMKLHVLVVNDVSPESVEKVGPNEYKLTDNEVIEEIFPAEDGSFRENFVVPSDKAFVLRLNQEDDDNSIYVKQSSAYVTTVVHDLKESGNTFEALTTSTLFSRYPGIAP